MLDQNTDRMWFVIGAVIVGAAIIFIANGTLPSLFASVTESFDTKAVDSENHVLRMRVGYQIPDYYDIATEDEFEQLVDVSPSLDHGIVGETYYRYTGESDYVIIPESINGEGVTSAYKMFAHTDVQGVATTSNIERMDYMFYRSTAEEFEFDYLDTRFVTTMQAMFRNTEALTIDVSHFNTSNVTNMQDMFIQTKATHIDVSGFDTSNVTNMNDMFYFTKVAELDLSSFDMSQIDASNRRNMFRESLATVVYAGSEEARERMHTSSYRPETLIVKIKE